MKRKVKRQALNFECPNCMIESSLAAIYANIPRLQRERRRACAWISGPQKKIHGRARPPILKARAIARGDKFQKCFSFASIDSKNKKKNVCLYWGARTSAPQFCSDFSFFFFLLKRTAIARGNHFRLNF